MSCLQPSLILIGLVDSPAKLDLRKEIEASPAQSYNLRRNAASMQAAKLVICGFRSFLSSRLRDLGDRSFGVYRFAS